MFKYKKGLEFKNKKSYRLLASGEELFLEVKKYQNIYLIYVNLCG
jgi:hypothetical protein